MKRLFNQMRVRNLVLLFLLSCIAVRAHAECQLNVANVSFPPTKNVGNLNASATFSTSDCAGKNWSSSIPSVVSTFGSEPIVALFFINGNIVDSSSPFNGSGDVSSITIDVFVGEGDITITNTDFLSEITNSGSFNFNASADFSHAPSDGGVSTDASKSFTVSGEILTSCQFSSPSFNVKFGVVGTNTVLKKAVALNFRCTTSSVPVRLTSTSVLVGLSGGATHVAALYESSTITTFINGINLLSSTTAKGSTSPEFEVRVGSGTLTGGVTGAQSGSGTFSVEIPITIIF